MHNGPQKAISTIIKGEAGNGTCMPGVWKEQP